MARLPRAAVVRVWFGILIAITCGRSFAGTIIKLQLGSDIPPELQYDGAVLSTVDDGIAATTGKQNTDIDFDDFLSGLSDVATVTASFTLNGLATNGSASVFGGTLVIQNFLGGTINLYDPSNSLLLSGTLGDSALSGTIGPPGTGAVFTATLSFVTGGSLAPLIDNDSLTMSINLTDVNDSAGFSVSGGNVLNPFTADAAVNLAADAVPEPAMLLLPALAAVGGRATRPKRRAR
jgi:hypothetical protein